MPAIKDLITARCPYPAPPLIMRTSTTPKSYYHQLTNHVYNNYPIKSYLNKQKKAE